MLLALLALFTSTLALGPSEANALVGTPPQLNGAQQWINGYDAASTNPATQCNITCQRLTAAEASNANMAQRAMRARVALKVAAQRFTVVGSAFWIGWKIGGQINRRWLKKTYNLVGSGGLGVSGIHTTTFIGWVMLTSPDRGPKIYPGDVTYQEGALRARRLENCNGTTYQSGSTPIGTTERWEAPASGNCSSGAGVAGKVAAEIYKAVPATVDWPVPADQLATVSTLDAQLGAATGAELEGWPATETQVKTQIETDTHLNNDVQIEFDQGQFPSPWTGEGPQPDPNGDPIPEDSPSTDDPNAGGGAPPGNSECDTWVKPRLRLGPLNQPYAMQFPFGVPIFMWQFVASLDGSAQAPSFAIPIVGSELELDLATFDPAMAIIRPVLAVVFFLSAGLMFGRWALGSPGGGAND